MDGITSYRDCLKTQLERLNGIDAKNAEEAAAISHAVCEVMNTILRLSLPTQSNRPLPENAAPYSPPPKDKNKSAVKSTMTPAEAAQLLGKNPMTIRIGLRDGSITWGSAVMNPKTKTWSYIISREKFSEATGIYFDADGNPYSECGRI